jgi:hypothetical protein
MELVSPEKLLPWLSKEQDDNDNSVLSLLLRLRRVCILGLD